MGRQIQINATLNDIRMLIEAVKKEYPTICRLDRKGTTVFPSYDLYDTGNKFGRQFYITTDEIWQTVKKLTEDFDREYPAFADGHMVDYLDQCVEILPSISIKDDQIIGSLDTGRRLYVNTVRMEAVDRLYSCFIKQTRRITIKYKHESPIVKTLLYSFPEADKIVKDYLLNESEKNDSIKLYFPDGYKEAIRQSIL